MKYICASFRQRLKLYPLILFLFSLWGCASHSQYVPASFADEHTPTAIPYPENTILLIYNHGSQAEHKKDYCYPNSWTTPTLIKNLSGEKISRFEIVVYAYCSPWRFGGYNGMLRMGEPKVIKRAKSIEKLVEQFINNGVANERIFLVGHSAGAWASLLVARRGNVSFNSVIGFAPAFSGKRENRSEGWWHLRDQQVDYLQEASSLPALIYAFEDDPYNDVKALNFLRDINGVVFISTDDMTNIAKENNCSPPSGHRGSFKNCFTQTQLNVVKNYIKQRITAQ